MAGSHHLLRIDDDVDYDPPTNTPDLTGIDAVILSDYDKGWLDYSFVVNLILACRVHLIPVVVDPKGEDFSKYRGCTIICPNYLEAENVVMNDFPTILFKLGERGLSLHENGIDKHFPATSQTVFDVCGAGDTVVAVIGACLAAGINLHTAAELANLAAGHVVGQVGTATCSADQLRALL
jgi:D-beta-D-heptose 7-phosphate kinase/D-beta-D-heptose 1-phosphate adenosyltransferase